MAHTQLKFLFFGRKIFKGKIKRYLTYNGVGKGFYIQKTKMPPRMVSVSTFLCMSRQHSRKVRTAQEQVQVGVQSWRHTRQPPSPVSCVSPQMSARLRQCQAATCFLQGPTGCLQLGSGKGVFLLRSPQHKSCGPPSPVPHLSKLPAGPGH